MITLLNITVVRKVKYNFTKTSSRLYKFKLLFKNKSLMFYYKIVHYIYKYSPFMSHVVLNLLPIGNFQEMAQA